MIFAVVKPILKILTELPPIVEVFLDFKLISEDNDVVIYNTCLNFQRQQFEYSDVIYRLNSSQQIFQNLNVFVKISLTGNNGLCLNLL